MRPEYIEGREAAERFEKGMKALFNVPKEKVVQAEKRAKKKRASRAENARKQTASDKD
jgi:hypothetical protein